MSKPQQQLEHLSAVFDGQDLNNLKQEHQFLDEQEEHLQNWSLIGAAIRDELHSDLPKDFASNVMNSIENISIEQVIHEDKEDDVGFSIVPYIKRASVYISQLAIAAAVAGVTVVGYQTYNAADEAKLITPAASSNLAVSGVNLASFDASGSDNMIHLNDMQANDGYDSSAKNELEIRQQQNEELQKINSFLEGYVFDANNN